ncbi:MAG: zinc transporter ZupT [Oscillospiraceae bacterium]|nr:zinc transporter ZupT [Oscillospiraceae bacterium]
MQNEVIVAFALSMIAGLATTIGGAFVVFADFRNKKILTSALGFSGAVMVMVSLAELFPEAVETLGTAYGDFWGEILVCAVILIGIISVILAEKFFKGSEQKGAKLLSGEVRETKSLIRLGFLLMGTMMLHNLPEGVATFMASYKNLEVGIAITIAIALHNIPEGIAVSMPIFYGTKSKGKAIFIAFLSGISEPFGALLAYLLLMPFISDVVLGIIFAFVCGIMLAISFAELLPKSSKDDGFASSYGVVLGITFMMCAMSLI